MLQAIVQSGTLYARDCYIYDHRVMNRLVDSLGRPKTLVAESALPSSHGISKAAMVLMSFILGYLFSIGIELSIAIERRATASQPERDSLAREIHNKDLLMRTY